MRKVLLITLVVFFVVACGGYCIAWFSQASQIKNGVEQMIAKINTQQKYVTYDAIETSGFPMDVYVSIVNPHFAGRIDPMLKTLVENSHPNQPGATESIPQWDEDAKLNGRIIIGINALSNHYSLRISGNWERNSKVGGQPVAIASESTGDTICTLQMSHTGGIFDTLWDFHALVPDNGKDFMNNLRLFDCSGMPAAISDSTSHEKLMGNGPWRFYVSSAPKGADREGRLYIKVSDVEITPQGDAIMSLQRNAFSPDFSIPIKYSLFGKQNLEIDLSYTGPSDWKAAGSNPPLDIKLSKFDINNQMYTAAITFFLSNGMNGANRAARLAYKAESSSTEQYDTFLQDMAHGFIAQLYSNTSNNKQFVMLQPYLQKYTPDQMYAIIAPAIPNLHSLGKIVDSVDLSYQGTPDFATGDVTLSDLEISASPYGITGKGSLRRTAGKPLPVGKIDLFCRNCMQLADDVIAYAARLQKTFGYFETPEKLAAETPIEGPLADGIKNFLKAIGQPNIAPDSPTFTFVINSDEATGMTVNGKNANILMALYNQYIGSVLKPQQPAASGAAPVQTAPATAAPTH